MDESETGVEMDLSDDLVFNQAASSLPTKGAPGSKGFFFI